MRKLVVTQHVSLDGSIELLTEWSDPTQPDEELADVTRQHSERSDALLVGRKTFVEMREYWPKQTDDITGVTAHLNQVQKYVVSSTLTEPGWGNTTVLGADWLDSLVTLKSIEGEEIVLTGSISVCHAVIKADLVDEYRLFQYPAVQGGGRPLFPEGVGPRGLTHVHTQTFGSGVVLLTYRS